MNSDTLQFVPFRLDNATEEDFNDLIDLLHIEAHESNPQDPEPPRTGTRRNIESIKNNPFVETELYLVRSGNDTLVGRLRLLFTRPEAPDYAHQKHLAFVGVYVVPDMRRQGFGTQMLRYAVDICQQRGLTDFEGGSGVDAGKAFADRIGAHVGQVESYSRVNMTDIDWQMMAEWSNSGQRRNPDTQLVRFEGLYSEDDAELARFCDFISAIRSTVPEGDLSGFTKLITPDMLRKDIAGETQRGVTSTYMVTVETDGRLSGYTRINHRADFGHKIEQRMTGVLVAERGRGLGKWLKAAMALHIKATYPDVAYINTSNDETNGPMLSINERMGFKLYKQQVYYGLSLNDAKQYLAMR